MKKKFSVLLLIFAFNFCFAKTAKSLEDYSNDGVGIVGSYEVLVKQPAYNHSLNFFDFLVKYESFKEVKPGSCDFTQVNESNQLKILNLIFYVQMIGDFSSYSDRALIVYYYTLPKIDTVAYGAGAEIHLGKDTKDYKMIEKHNSKIKDLEKEVKKRKLPKLDKQVYKELLNKSAISQKDF